MSDYIKRAIDHGFFFECPCGERYRGVRGAVSCRKCRVYLESGHHRTVVDIRTNEVVWPEPLTPEQVAANRRYDEEEARIAARRAYHAEQARAPFTLAEFLSPESLDAIVTAQR